MHSPSDLLQSGHTASQNTAFVSPRRSRETLEPSSFAFVALSSLRLPLYSSVEGRVEDKLGANNYDGRSPTLSQRNTGNKTPNFTGSQIICHASRQAQALSCRPAPGQSKFLSASPRYECSFRLNTVFNLWYRSCPSQYSGCDG